jgi:hypothetical protein
MRAPCPAKLARIVPIAFVALLGLFTTILSACLGSNQETGAANGELNGECGSGYGYGYGCYGNCAGYGYGYGYGCD